MTKRPPDLNFDPVEVFVQALESVVDDLVLRRVVDQGWNEALSQTAFVPDVDGPPTHETGKYKKPCEVFLDDVKVSYVIACRVGDPGWVEVVDADFYGRRPDWVEAVDAELFGKRRILGRVHVQPVRKSEGRTLEPVNSRRARRELRELLAQPKPEYPGLGKALRDAPGGALMQAASPGEDWGPKEPPSAGWDPYDEGDTL